MNATWGCPRLLLCRDWEPLERSAKRGDASARCQPPAAGARGTDHCEMTAFLSLAPLFHRLALAALRPRSQTPVGMRLCVVRSPWPDVGTVGCPFRDQGPRRLQVYVFSSPISTQHSKLGGRSGCELGRCELQACLSTCSETGCWQQTLPNQVAAPAARTAPLKSCVAHCRDSTPGGSARVPPPAGSELPSTLWVQYAALGTLAQKPKFLL